MRKTACGLLLIFVSCPVIAQDVTYDVNHSFTDNFWGTNATATLTGTLTAPLGGVELSNHLDFFTNVNLTLTVNGSSFHLDHAVNGTQGSGGFLIFTNPTTLTLDPWHGDSGNPANISFEDAAGNYYAVGVDFFHFESASTSAGQIADVQASFPIVFGRAVPEPTSAALFAFAAMIFGMQRSRKRSV